jgi:hypothetical protein
VPFEPQRDPSATRQAVEDFGGLDSALDQAFDPSGAASAAPPSRPLPPLVGAAATGSQPSERRSWAVPAIVVAAILGVSAIVVAVLVTRDWTRPDEPSEPSSQFILVKGTVVPEGVRTSDGGTLDRGDVDAVAPLGDGAAQGDAALASDAPRKTPTSPTKVPGEIDVARAFAGQRGRIAACYETHAESGTDVPQIDIDFTVGDDGSVRRVALQPEAIRSTSLGSCIARVASSTRFPSSGREVEFRIPIKARRVGELPRTDPR